MMTDSSETGPAAEWDSNARARHQQIVAGADISYTRILVPTILELLGDTQGKTILDAGCGSGTLTALLAQKAKSVIGVDQSPSMIEIAFQEYGGESNLHFVNATIEKYAVDTPSQRFDACVSNMALMNLPDLFGAVSAIRLMLKPRATIVLTITHPWFWHQYKRVSNSEKFDYLTPHIRHAPFVISLDQKPLPTPTTIFHRPLQTYFDVLYNNDLHVERLLEPFPSPEIERLYPQPWEFPRFLALKCRHEPGLKKPTK